VPAASGRRIFARRLTLIPVLAVLGLSSLALGGCELGGGDDDDAVATKPTTTAKEATTEPSGNAGQATTPPSTTTTTTTTPESGGTGTPPPDSGGTGAPPGTYDPEKDVEGHDIPPPPGSPAEQFEKECAENPEIC
jgi:hypothetical protein